MTNVKKDIQKQLFEMQDLGYKDFCCRLIPTLDPNLVIGVRTPMLRKFAKKMAKDPQVEEFLADLPHKYYEENNLHGFIVAEMKDYDQCLQHINELLPYIDNWATCDMIAPKVFKKHLPELLDSIKEWMASKETYTIRFGIGMLMKFYLNDEFNRKYLDVIAAIRSEEYYVNMMIAWYFATALAKQYDATLPYIEKKKLETWTHNKAIQKAVESYRITSEQKMYLKTLKIK